MTDLECVAFLQWALPRLQMRWPGFRKVRKQGRYSIGSLKELPRAWLEEDFERVEDEYCVRDRLRESVSFHLQDIRRELPEGPFDLILCRNLICTYFKEPLQTKVLGRVLDRLAPEGVFVIGKQESLPAGIAGLVECAPHTRVYRRSENRALA